MRQEVLISDLGAIAQPRSAVNTVRYKNVWAIIPYETDTFSGTFLSAIGTGEREDVTLPVNLSGWYRIFVGLPRSSDHILLRLTKDGAATPFSATEPGALRGYYDPRIRSYHQYYYDFEEVFWKCADMTDQDVIVSKFIRQASTSIVSWFRFIPMTDEEVSAFHQEQARTDTKRLYCTHDMFNMLVPANSQADWRTIVQSYEQSDAEWLSLENILYFDGEVPTGDMNNFAYSPGYDVVCKKHKNYTREMLKDLVDYGHSFGLKMCSSRRMGSWDKEFPHDQMLFATKFVKDHPEFHCVDRDGTVMTALSYCYSEVQDYVIDQFVDMAKLGFDAVETIFTRGVPYVLFEQPFVDRFQEIYGEDPRELPMDEPRVMALRCEFMTGFMRRLRQRLDAEIPDRKVGIHGRVFFSLYENKMISLDPETWAKEGLVTALISFPQVTREILPKEVFREDAPGRIDLEKYTKYAKSKGHELIYWNQNFWFHEPMPDSHGIPQGPRNQEERIREFMNLEENYGVRFYVELFPRHMPAEEYQRKALELYSYGCQRFSFWDTYVRVPFKTQWSMVRRLGHKEELSGFTNGEGEYWRVIPIVSKGGQDVSRYMPSFGG